MSVNLLRSIMSILLLLMMQVSVFNNIHMFGYATPMLLIIPFINMQRSLPRWLTLIMAFLTGLLADLFTNTPGLNAAAMTLTSFIQPHFLETFLNHESSETLKPGARSLGIVQYMLYAFVLIFIYCLAFFTLEAFTFFHFTYWVLSIVGSTLLTFIITLLFENIRSGK